MVEEKEELLEKLRIVKKTAEKYLEENNFDNYIVKDVVRYNKKVELTQKDSADKTPKEFYLNVVELENTNPELEEEPLEKLIYLEEEEGNLYTISDLIQEYDGFENINEVIKATKENEEKPEEEQDPELKKDSLEELEAEKEKEQEELGTKEAKEEKREETEEKEEEEKQKEDTKNDLTGAKPKYVMQTIDVDKAYVDEWTTVREAYDLPPEVEHLAIAAPNQKDENILSNSITMYMLDNNDRVIENVKGKTIEDYFEIDDSTGNNPTNDENTKLELDGYAERNENQTMRRFISKANPDLYLSVEQKEVGEYHEVYAGRKTMDGNDAVEVQLETRNVEIQNSLDMQKIVSGRKGIYNPEEIDEEVDAHEEHGDEEDEIAIENADGEDTIAFCDSPYVPDTEITWEQFSKLLGDKHIKDIGEEFFEQYDGTNGLELVLKMQAEHKSDLDLDLDLIDEEIDEIDDEYVKLIITSDTQLPDSDKTVEEWAEELGESVGVIVERLQREIDKNDGRKPIEIVKDIEEDYGRAGHEHKH